MTEDMGILRRFRLITVPKMIFNIYLFSGPKLYVKVYLVNLGSQAWYAYFLIPFVCVVGFKRWNIRTLRTYQANVPPLSCIPSQRQVLFSFLTLLKSE